MRFEYYIPNRVSELAWCIILSGLLFDNMDNQKDIMYSYIVQLVCDRKCKLYAMQGMFDLVIAVCLCVKGSYTFSDQCFLSRAYTNMALLLIHSGAITQPHIVRAAIASPRHISCAERTPKHVAEQFLPCTMYHYKLSDTSFVMLAIPTTYLNA